jgi:hypothetical protein
LMQLCAIKFICYLLQFGCFLWELWFPPPIKMDCDKGTCFQNIVGKKVALSIHKHNLGSSTALWMILQSLCTFIHNDILCILLFLLQWAL